MIDEIRDPITGQLLAYQASMGGTSGDPPKWWQQGGMFGTDATGLDRSRELRQEREELEDRNERLLARLALVTAENERLKRELIDAQYDNVRLKYELDKVTDEETRRYSALSVAYSDLVDENERLKRDVEAVKADKEYIP